MERTDIENPIMGSQSSHSKPTVSIILLNWNSYQDTKECIQSLLCATYPGLHIVVVDNASSDDSLQRLQAEFPQIDFIKNDENLGFAAGNNVGINFTIKRGSDYVLLLNNDTLVTPIFLEPAIAFAEQNPQVGLVGGKIYYHNEGKRIWDAGGEIDWLWGHGKRIGTGQVDIGQYNVPRLTTFVTGCMMLIKRQVLLKVGTLPEVYFFGVEEWDYSVQVRRSGYQLAYVPDFVIWHKVGRSHTALSPRWVYCYLRSRMLFMRRHTPKYWYWIWLTGMWLHSLYKKYIQLPRLSPHNAAILRIAVSRAFHDHCKKASVTRKDIEQFL